MIGLTPRRSAIPARRLRLANLRFYSNTKIAAAQPIVELREYAVRPEHAADFWHKTSLAGDLRKSLAPLRLFSRPETGGQLHVATHAYYYAGGHAERDEIRRIMTENPHWNEYVSIVLSCLENQNSTIWVEPPLVLEHPQVHGISTVTTNLPGDNAIFEFRRYKLKLGYETVPIFMELYNAGLPSKLHALGTDPTTSLITLLYTEVGRLNEVLEIWRHGGGSTAMEVSRQAARGAVEWRSAIASIADLAVEFTSAIHKPTLFSPIQ